MRENNNVALCNLYNSEAITVIGSWLTQVGTTEVICLKNRGWISLGWEQGRRPDHIDDNGAAQLEMSVINMATEDWNSCIIDWRRHVVQLQLVQQTFNRSSRGWSALPCKKLYSFNTTRSTWRNWIRLDSSTDSILNFSIHAFIGIFQCTPFKIQ